MAHNLFKFATFFVRDEGIAQAIPAHKKFGRRKMHKGAQPQLRFS
jgi:hypothetical protein